MKTSASQTCSAEPQESTMSLQWMISPSTWQTLVNHLLLWIGMQSCHLADTDAAISHATAWYLPALMVRALRDPMNDASHLPVPIPEVQPPREGDVSSSLHHDLCHHITATMDPFLPEAWDDVSSSFNEHFPTAPLDDDVWLEEQILDRCLCIHERPDEPNHQCSYPCPHDSNAIFWMDLWQSTPHNEAMFNYNPMDFSGISSDLPDIIIITSDADITDLDDVSDAVWFT